MFLSIDFSLYFLLFRLSHRQPYLFYKLSGGGQPPFDLYTGFVFPSRKSMIQLLLWTTKPNPCAASVHKEAVHKMHAHTHTRVCLKHACPTCVCTYSIVSPSMHTHIHTQTQTVSVCTFLKCKNRRKGLGDSFGTARCGGHSIHHCKPCNKRDTNRTVQGKIKQVTSNNTVELLYEEGSGISSISSSWEACMNPLCSF